MDTETTPFGGEFRFRWGTDDETGADGWCPTWVPHSTPGGGMLAAHDVLEHDHTDEAAIDHDNEAEALGSALWVRGRNGMLGNAWYPEPYQSLSGDIGRLWTDSYEWGDVSKPPRTLSCDAWFENQVERALERCKSELKSELGLMHDEMPPPSWWRWVRARLRRGYHSAQARFSGIGCTGAGSLFKSIESGVDSHRHAEQGEGLLVIIRPGEEWADVHHIERWDDRHSEYEPLDEEED